MHIRIPHLLLFAVLMLIVSLGTAMAQSCQTISVPPDPGDGPGNCFCPSACGWWSCFIGTCSSPCAMPKKLPPIINPMVALYTRIKGYSPVVKEQPTPTNQTFPDPPTPDQKTDQKGLAIVAKADDV